MKKRQIVKKTMLALACCLLVASVAPTAGFSHPYHGGGGGGWGWGLAGLLVGTAVVASVVSQPTVVYAAPPPPVYVTPSSGYAAAPPAAPPGSCRWERYVLDGYGRQVLDQYGHPVKEYTIGPC